MSLPSKYAPGGLDINSQKKVITTGHIHKGVNYIEKTIDDRVDDAVEKQRRNLTTEDDDIEMIPIEEDRDIQQISSYVNSSRENDDVDYNNNVMEVELDVGKECFGFGYTSQLIVDTNFILSHLDVLDELKNTAEKYNIRIIIPIAVMKELDGLKNSTKITDEGGGVSVTSVSHLARWANDWIYSMLAKSSKIVVGQRLKQRIDTFAIKDDAILDCCLYFKREYAEALVILLSDDKNLCMKALSNDILTISYRKHLNARLIGETVHLESIQKHDKNLQFDPNAKQFPTEILVSNETNIESRASQVFNEVQKIVASMIHRCMGRVYGEDIELLQNYDENSVTTLKQSSDVIIRFWFPVFQNYFQSTAFKPFSEEGKGKMSLKQGLYYTESKSDRELGDFIDFWSRFLVPLYDSEMNEEQVSSLHFLIKRWKGMVRT